MRALLDVHGLQAGYGASRVLQGVDLAVRRDEAVTLLGRNGVGKTTLIHALMGMVSVRAGSVRFDDAELAGAPSHVIARHGVSLVPQGRRLFAPLTVEENLRLAQRGRRGDWDLQRVYDLLPRLAERRRHRGDQLSGGEQQMAAIGRALLANPRMLLLDEPSEGLAPRLVEEIGTTLAELRGAGIAVLLVEQNLHLALSLADRVAILHRGAIAYDAPVAAFRRDPDAAHRLLGV